MTFRGLMWTALVLFVVAFWATAGLLVNEYRHLHAGEFNWAIQGQDGAIAGCPGQYKVWTNVNHVPFLTGCWGDSRVQ